MENKNEKVSWNLAQNLVMEIGEILHESTKAYLSGDIIKWFFQQKAIKMLVVSSLGKDERKIMSDRETVISQLIKPATSEFVSPKVNQRAVRAKLAFLVEKYSECLMDLLEKYGYLISKRENAGRMVA